MQAWFDFLNDLEKDFGKETITKWLRCLKIVKFDALNLFLEAEDEFQVIWFEEHIQQIASRAFTNNNQKPIKIHLNVRKTLDQPSIKPADIKPSSYQQDVIKKEATFQLFVETEGNKMALQILSDLVGYDKNSLTFKKPSLELGAYNPILIYGPHESGKTHLLMSMQHALAQAGFRSLYVKTDTFTDHVIRAIRNGSMADFRNMYRNQDVLLVDDIEILSKKAATQEEFFHTFNTLHSQGKQIILSSALAPKFLVDIEPRLVSRFEWGLTISLKPLDEKDLQNLVHLQLKKLSYSLTPEALNWLCQTFTLPSNILKALDILKFRSQLFRQKQGQTLPLDVVQSYLNSFEAEIQSPLASPHRIIQELALSFNVKIEDLLGKSQAREHTTPRQIAMYACRLALKMPYAKIGDFFSRDHSTVMSSVKQIELSMKNNEEHVVNALNSLYRKIGKAS